MATLIKAVDKGRHRVGKGLTQVTTRGHANCESFKFRFELKELSVSNLRRAKGDVVLVWKRRDKEITTEPATVEGGKVYFGDGLRFSCTLFRTPDSDVFMTKMARLTLKAGSATGKPLAKVDFNVGEYASAPSGDKTVSLRLSDGSNLCATCTSTLAKSGRARNGSGGSRSSASSRSSAYSQLTTGTGGLSQGDGYDDVGDIDDFKDLEILDDDLAGFGATPVSTNGFKNRTSRTDDLNLEFKDLPGVSGGMRAEANLESIESGFDVDKEPVRPASALPMTRADDGLDIDEPVKPRGVFKPTQRSSTGQYGSSISPGLISTPRRSEQESDRADTGEARKPPPLLGKLGFRKQQGAAGAAGKPLTAEQKKRLEILTDEYNTLSGAATRSQVLVEQLRSELEGLQAELLDKKKELALQAEMGSNFNTTMTTLTDKVKRLYDFNDTLEQRVSTSSQELTMLREENNRLKSEEEDLEEKLAEFEDKNYELRAQLEEESSKLSEAEPSIVEELKSLKLQLATSSFERDQAAQQLRELGRLA